MISAMSTGTMQYSLFEQPESVRETAGEGQTRPSFLTAGELNEAQHAAVTAADGPVLVIAGAGSGKTRTLVYRVAWLIEQGVDPARILLLTFTRRSAQEMLARAAQLVDESSRRVMGGTFHAVANLLLRRFRRLPEFANGFTIIDRADAEGIVNLVKASLFQDKKDKRFPSKSLIVNILGQAVNRDATIADIMAGQYGHLADYIDDVTAIHDQYEKFKADHALMDYDDLLVNWKRLLTLDDSTRQDIAGLYSHILVDEYQDTNRIQAEIVRLMAHGHDNVMAVGDDSQSIYSFRGADFRNIMDFPKLFPGARIMRLEENYRSTEAVLAIANSTIEHAREKYTKVLYTRQGAGDRPESFEARDEFEQARYVTGRIRELRDNGMKLSDMAVLFRSGFHSFKLEMELASAQIPFEKRGGLKLTESAHIKDILSYLRILANPFDLLSWNRVLLLIEKVGPGMSRKILDHIGRAEDPVEALAGYPATGLIAKSLEGLAAMLKAARTAATPVGKFEEALACYRPLFERIYHDDYPRRLRDLEQLQTIAAEYRSLQSFLDDTALDPPEAAGASGQAPGDRLILSTVHSAKGLEWDVVFIIHLTEGKFPSGQAMDNDQTEEERRLFYVAVTRARKRLYLVYPRRAAAYDQQMQFEKISPFLSEIPPALLNNPYRTVPVIPRLPSALPAAPPKAAANPGAGTSVRLAPGMGVRHPFFGEGTVEAVTGTKSVDVFFPRHGRKTLHLDYARLEILSSP